MTKTFCDDCGAECSPCDEAGERFEVKRGCVRFTFDVSYSMVYLDPGGIGSQIEPGDLCRACLVKILKGVQP